MKKFIKKNIFLIGPMGSGKSTIGLQLSKKLEMDFFDSDQEIKNRTGANISWVFDIEGEKKFRKREENIIKKIAKNKGIILATGGGSILSRKIRTVLSSQGIVIYLKTTIKNQLLRTKQGKHRPLLKDKKFPENFLKKLSKKRNPLYKEIADITIINDEKNFSITVQKIIDILKNSKF